MTAGYVLLHTDSYSGIFIYTVDKPGDNTDCKKEAQPPVPWDSIATCHILQKNNNDIGDTGDIGCCLSYLPKGYLKS